MNNYWVGIINSKAEELIHYDYVKGNSELSAVLAVFQTAPVLKNYLDWSAGEIVQSKDPEYKILSKLKDHLEYRGLIVISQALPE